MIIGPHINFNGNCEEAMKTYEKIFGGSDLKMVKYGDIDSDAVNDDEKDRILIGEMNINNTTFLFSDVPQYVHGNNLAIAIKLKLKEEVQEAFNALKGGATVHIELGPTFFSPMYVFFTDKFGVTWEFMCSE